MANASFDAAKGTWWCQFQPLNGGGQRRKIRVRADRLPSKDPKEQKRLATAIAEECDRYCRLLEVLPTAPDIRHAERIRAITGEQAAALLRGQLAPPPVARYADDRVTLERAALMHPSSVRQTAKARRPYLKYLQEFTARTGIAALDDLTLESVQAYVAAMVTEGKPWDTRRHRLMYIRRASRMGAAHGIPDVLGELVLDRQGRRQAVAAYSIDELARALVALAGKPRARMAVALGGFLGLRPSEIWRVRCGDLRLDGMLPYATLPGREHDAKNEPSRRLLPVPPTIVRWMHELAAGRGADEPLVYAERGWQMNPAKAAADPAEARRRRRRFNDVSFAHWLGPKLEAATGRDLPPKALRKSFASWATRLRIEATHVEQYLGHENELVAAITGRHYLTDLYEVIAEMLLPTRDAIEQHLTAALARAQATVATAQPATMVQA